MAIGEVTDGLMFMLQAAANGDQEAMRSLKALRDLLEKVLKGDWNTSLGRIHLPR